MAYVNEILKAVKAQPAKSAWDKGVKAYAIDMLEDFYGGSAHLAPSNYRGIILDGAKDWSEYSKSGNALIYDADIAKRLCTPSEYKRLKARGFPDPNPREDWIQVQARACYQASILIGEAISAVDKAKAKAKKKPVKKTSSKRSA